MFNQLAPVTSKDLNLQQLVGCRVVMVYARPYAQEPMIEECTVQAINITKRGKLELLVKPDASHLFAKWRDESEFVSYVKTEVSAQLSA